MEKTGEEIDTMKAMRAKVWSESSKISREIKILAEVEKIWIKFNKPAKDTLSYREMVDWLKV